MQLYAVGDAYEGIVGYCAGLSHPTSNGWLTSNQFRVWR